MEPLNVAAAAELVRLLVPVLLFMCAIVVTVMLMRISNHLNSIGLYLKHISETMEEGDDAP